MPPKTYYDLLEIAPAATVDEIKKAFRQRIARYHPDKVQHLGQEFQEMAAGRAAELTEAYRILSDAQRRAEYDRTLSANLAPAFSPPPPAPPPSRVPEEPAASASAPPSPAGAEPPAGGAWFAQERATRDRFVRQALLGRILQALDEVAHDYDRTEVRGFDLACNPKGKLFARGRGPRLLGRFVPHVDAASVADAWTAAVKAGGGSDEVCVFLMGLSMAPSAELALAIAAQRKKSRGAKVSLIPIDVRDWDARMPTDAPEVAKSLVARLRTGAR